MTIVNKLSNGFRKIVDKKGEVIRVRYFSEVVGSVWDDDVTLTEVTGSEIWISGVILPLDKWQGSKDANLVEQGKLTIQDQKLYVNGSMDFTGIGSNFKVKIGINGSPIQAENYTIIPFGGVPYEVEGTQIYKKVYIRKLTNGSFIGES